LRRLLLSMNFSLSISLIVIQKLIFSYNYCLLESYHALFLFHENSIHSRIFLISRISWLCC
jgi:hypothetical protein